jgi:uncharacterized membrane protein
METSLIPAGNNFGVLAALLAAGAFAFWSERTRWGEKLSSAVVAILTGMLLSNLFIIPFEAQVYDAVWTYFVPLAIPMFLFQANIGKIFRESGKVLGAFFIGTFGTLAGGVAAFYLVPLGKETWKLTSVFCSTYIGGSMNFVGTSAVVDLKPGDLMTASLAADSLVGALYFLVIYALPSIPFFRKLFPIREAAEIGSDNKPDAAVKPETTASLFYPLAISGVVCAAGYLLAELLSPILKFNGLAILLITLLIIVIVNLFPKRLSQHSESGFKMGMVLMQIFFVVVGAAANAHVILNVGPKLILFVVIILSFQIVPDQ